ncbi:MAG: HNH endonuclease [Patescibacteria group bacterium]
MLDIAKKLNSDFNKIISDLYLGSNFSGQEISDELFIKTGIFITARSIQRQLRKLGIIRTFSEAFNISIKKGRKSYAHLRRTIKSKAMRKGIYPKLRYEIFSRDKFKCVLCGNTAADDHLEVDHIKPVVYGGTNEHSNLRTLCAECNKGKMLVEERKLLKI